MAGQIPRVHVPSIGISVAHAMRPRGQDPFQHSSGALAGLAHGCGYNKSCFTGMTSSNFDRQQRPTYDPLEPYEEGAVSHAPNDEEDAERRDAGAERASRRRLRFAGFVLLAVAILFLAAGFAAHRWLQMAMRASLPQIDGTVSVQGLRSDVSVLRDAHGVPTIRAASVDDVVFAQGFVTAQDRLWQMDAIRRHAAGELAEILGSKLLPVDRGAKGSADTSSCRSRHRSASGRPAASAGNVCARGECFDRGAEESSADRVSHSAVPAAALDAARHAAGRAGNV